MQFLELSVAKWKTKQKLKNAFRVDINIAFMKLKFPF